MKCKLNDWLSNIRKKYKEMDTWFKKVFTKEVCLVLLFSKYWNYISCSEYLCSAHCIFKSVDNEKHINLCSDV